MDPVADAYRPGIVHRLDKDTSGVMVVAKSRRGPSRSGAAFKKRLTEKEYVAIAVGDVEDGVHGRRPDRSPPGQAPADERRRLERPLGLDTWCASSRACPGTRWSRRSRTAVARTRSACTSRTSARRSSATSCTAPLGAIGRQALHAYRLSLPHPVDNQAITFTAQVPPDMVQAWLRARRLLAARGPPRPLERPLPKHAAR
jgi:23S rRNA pseudouridine1911/1915/1917 synthase